LEIEGLSSDWPIELDERNTVEAAALGQATIEATRRLDSLMRTQALAIRDTRRWRRRAALALAAAFFIGGASALLLRKPFILDAIAFGLAVSGVDKQKSALERFVYAEEIGTVGLCETA